MSTAEPALKFDMEVKEEGRVELRLPFPRGTHIVVFVVPESPDTFQDLTMAAQTSLDFWNNALDDEDWNNA